MMPYHILTELCVRLQAAVWLAVGSLSPEVSSVNATSAACSTTNAAQTFWPPAPLVRHIFFTHFKAFSIGDMWKLTHALPSVQSCQGRCAEQFRRGQLCECDPQCARHNTCCPDYQLHCGEDQWRRLTVAQQPEEGTRDIQKAADSRLT